MVRPDEFAYFMAYSRRDELWNWTFVAIFPHLCLPTVVKVEEEIVKDASKVEKAIVKDVVSFL